MRAIATRFAVDDRYGKARPCVFRGETALMALESRLEVVGDARVERRIAAAENIEAPTHARLLPGERRGATNRGVGEMPTTARV